MHFSLSTFMNDCPTVISIVISVPPEVEILLPHTHTHTRSLILPLGIFLPSFSCVPPVPLWTYFFISEADPRCLPWEISTCARKQSNTERNISLLGMDVSERERQCRIILKHLSAFSSWTFFPKINLYIESRLKYSLRIFIPYSSHVKTFENIAQTLNQWFLQ